jgi:hypothetical protein
MLLSTVVNVGVLVVRLEAAAATCKLLGFGGVPLEVGAVLPSPQFNRPGMAASLYERTTNRNKSSNRLVAESRRENKKRQIQKGF